MRAACVNRLGRIAPCYIARHAAPRVLHDLVRARRAENAFHRGTVPRPRPTVAKFGGGFLAVKIEMPAGVMRPISDIDYSGFIALKHSLALAFRPRCVRIFSMTG